jgi:predicted Zn-dependent protease
MRGDESTSSVIARARQMADSGHSVQALKLCQERTAQDPSEVGLWNLLAELQAESGHRQEALTNYLDCRIYRMSSRRET